MGMKHLKIRIPLECESKNFFYYVNHVAGDIYPGGEN